MYKRWETVFCGLPRLREFCLQPIAQGEVLVKVLSVYVSFADRGVVSCRLVARDSLRVLGTAAMGKIVDVGVGVDRQLEGKIVVTLPSCSVGVPPITINGPLQEFYSISSECIACLPPSYRGDSYAVLISALSIKKPILRLLKGAKVLLVGEDVSLLTFAHYAQRFSSSIAIIPRHTLWPDIVKGDHVSLYDREKLFDIVVVASDHGDIVELALSKLREHGIAIVHPASLDLIRTGSLRRSFRVVAMKFGDLSIGLEVYQRYTNVLRSRVPRYRIDSIELFYSIPSIAIP